MTIAEKLVTILDGDPLRQRANQSGIIETASKIVDDLETRGWIAPPTYRLAPATATPVKASSASSASWFRGF